MVLRVLLKAPNWTPKSHPNGPSHDLRSLEPEPGYGPVPPKNFAKQCKIHAEAKKSMCRNNGADRLLSTENRIVDTVSKRGSRSNDSRIFQGPDSGYGPRSLQI